MPARKTIRIRATRNGETVEGTFSYDGLASLWPVQTDAGEIRYVSCLWTVEQWEEVA